MAKDAGIEKDKATNSLSRVSSKVSVVDFNVFICLNQNFRHFHLFEGIEGDGSHKGRRRGGGK